MQEFNGYKNWQTFNVATLLDNIRPINEEARERFANQKDGTALAAWVNEWFWKIPSNLDQESQRTIFLVRKDMTRDEFDTVDWDELHSTIISDSE